MNIIQMAFRVTEAVAAYRHRVRGFYYEVMLVAHACPRCQGKLAMVAEGRCTCSSCAHVFDPTIAFQRCSDCGGTLKIEIRRYRCTRCGKDAPSRFLFDGLAFDADYFREKMAASRARRRQEEAYTRSRVAGDRSLAAEAGPIDLSAISGLADALSALVSGAPLVPTPYVRGDFDLSRYERHIRARLAAFPLCFDEIPPLNDNARLDRICRFIAIIFMAHAGLIEIRQEDQAIMVMLSEAH